MVLALWRVGAILENGYEIQGKTQILLLQESEI